MRKKEVFRSPFIGIDEKKYAILYDIKGNYSVYIEIENPCVQYNGDVESYYQFQTLFANIIKVVGDGYSIQKQDVQSKKKWHIPYKADDYLMQRHFEHFENRVYKAGQTILIITGEVSKSFMSYDNKKFEMFIANIDKVLNIFQDKGLRAHAMNKKEMTAYLYRYFAMDFEDDACSLDNFSAKRDHLQIGDKNVRCISLVDVELVEMPNTVKPFENKLIANRRFPIDLFAFLPDIPTDTVIYNQVVHTVSQGTEKAKLEAKKKRHSSMPDAANNLCIEDINSSMDDIERNGQMLVYTHFDIIISGKEDLSRAQNMLETFLLDTGIRISKQAYNQYELFRAAMPGNSYELKDYDLFLTSADVAVSLMYKEKLPESENSDFLFWVNDRQGVPLAIDPSDLAMYNGRCQNRNKFILGPSGSGKSFYMNSMMMQYALNNTDIVIVDTGHSYSGLCEYLHGHYITYSEENPITMNPFRIKKEEYNLEKVEFLKNLIILLWKGTDEKTTKDEAKLIHMTIRAYYSSYFYGNVQSLSESDKDAIREQQIANWKDEQVHDADEQTIEQKLKKINSYILEEQELLEKRGEEERVQELSFNSFYEFAIKKIELLAKDWSIMFNVKSFAFQLEAFYKGGMYERTLNENSDASLFDEKFIVFEIDSIKDNPDLFPIVTLVIMDIFIQKMRLKKNRKALIIEEAWKAIANELMANYILYLYKTVRKFFGEAMVVTQELDDVLKSPVVRQSIVANSDQVILLDQTKFKDNFEEISEVLSLSAVEQNKIFTVNNLDNKAGRSRFKEFYIKRGSEGETYGLEVSQHEYFTFTTERPEKDAVKVYEMAYNNFQNGLDAFVNDFNESKLPIGTFIAILNTPYLAKHLANGIEHFQEIRNKIFKEFKDSGKSISEFKNYLNKKADGEYIQKNTRQLHAV